MLNFEAILYPHMQHSQERRYELATLVRRLLNLTHLGVVVGGGEDVSHCLEERVPVRHQAGLQQCAHQLCARDGVQVGGAALVFLVHHRVDVTNIGGGAHLGQPLGALAAVEAFRVLQEMAFSIRQADKRRQAVRVAVLKRMTPTWQQAGPSFMNIEGTLLRCQSVHIQYVH